MLAFPIRTMTALAVCSAFAAQPALADGLNVVATIKPVHSLTAAVMQGVGEPTLLIQSAGSPHSYALRPSEARALERADIVIRVGESLETFLQRPLETLAADARIVTLVEADDLNLLSIREGGVWESHAHDEHGHDGHGHDDEAHADVHADHHDGHHEEHEEHADASDHDELDMHLWLDPRNAAAMARMIAAALIAADPVNAPAYRANAAQLDADLDALERSIGERLEAVLDRPFVVFHDAYQYFEHRFDVNTVGSITVTPDVQPGAARLRELRRTVAERQARCVFSEPQFEPRLVETVVEGTDARAGTLDPLGAALPEGPGQYFMLMETMADSLIDCLGGAEAG